MLDSEYKECDSTVVNDEEEHGEKESKQVNENNRNSNKTHHRKRKKQFFNTIRHQMEFYFGDANLSKDRFINKLLAKDPYVPLNIFLKFNKIKEFTHSIEDIQKAIEGSKILALSADKQSVRRTTEIQKKDDIDEYMVYVEALPPNATHESVKNQFKQFGNVAYVSLPKYRSSGRIKEFAFVEFEEKCSVERCINAFRQFDGVIGEHFDAENLKSIGAYVKEQEEIEGKEQSAENNIAELNEDKTEETKTEAVTENEDSKLTETDQDCAIDAESATDVSDVESLSSHPPPAKRAKCSDTNQTKTDEIKEADDKLKQENDDHGIGAADNNQDEQSKNKRKRRRHKPKKAENGKNCDIESANMQDPWNTNGPSSSLDVLRVATKTDWKHLRNKYLAVQREKYAEVKKLLHQQKKQGETAKKSTLPPFVRPVTMKMKNASPPPPKRICTRNINFYGAMRDDQVHSYECSIVDGNKSKSKNSSNKSDEQPNVKESQFVFEPGLIVKVNFETPCIDTADFKAEMKQYSLVRYVDIKEGQTFAFVRVDSARSAPILIKHCAPNRCQILTGDSETEYWTKIAKDREQKLSKAVKIPKNRGRKIQNLLRNIVEVNIIKGESKTTSSHIRFDD